MMLILDLESVVVNHNNLSVLKTQNLRLNTDYWVYILLILICDSVVVI